MNARVISSLFVLIVVGLMMWFVWVWGFCRFFVPPGHMAIITAKVGEPLPADQILAKKGQLGVQEEVLGEGRHFLNPWLYEVKIVPMINIPATKIGIVTAKVGKNLQEGEFLASKGEKGIWREVLGPGRYRLNPEGYEITILDAISIPIGYAGVVTSLAGNQAAPGEFALKNQKGVRADILQPGLYYANPKEFKIDVLEIGVNQVSLLGAEGGQVITKTRLTTQNAAMAELEENVLQEQQANRSKYIAQKMQDTARAPQVPPVQKDKRQGVSKPNESSAAMELAQFVEFPSRDGFNISIDMTVEFELLPKHIASIYRAYGDLPAVVDKIIMPQIQSISRLKGSAYRAKDFIVGEGREKFQNDLKSALEATLGEKHIVVHNALIRHVGVPDQILDPIQKASIAIEEDLTNKEKQNTAKKQAELNTELSLIEQKGQQVNQETQKLKGEIKAFQEKEVARITAESQKKVAEIEKAIASVRAEMTLKVGKAKADVVRMVEGEKAKGFVTKSTVFVDPAAYSLYQFAESLNPDISINIIHAGQGTLWTDLQKATMSEVGGASIIKAAK